MLEMLKELKELCGNLGESLRKAADGIARSWEGQLLR